MRVREKSTQEGGMGMLGRHKDATRAGRPPGRRLRLGLAVLLACGLVAVGRLGGPVGQVHAATDTVTDCTGPVGPGRLATVVAGAAAGDTITFSCSGTITLTSPLTLNQSVTIDGSGQTVTISGGNTVGVVSVAPGVTATLTDLTISNGSAASGGGIVNGGTLTINTSTISNNTATGAGGGGGIVNGGILTINTSTISNNTATGGGGVANLGTLTVNTGTISNNMATGTGGGGGILNAATLTIAGSTINGNSAPSGPGGGISTAGTLTISNSTISGNLAPSSGGGGIANLGTLTVTAGTINGNTASDGGGIFNINQLTISTSAIDNNIGTTIGGGIMTSGTLTMDTSTISNNLGGANGGGGIVNLGTLTITAGTISDNQVFGTGGGGILNLGTSTISASTINGNTIISSGSGAGIGNGGGTLTINTSTISNNSISGAGTGGGLVNSATLTIGNSTISGNTATGGGGIINSGPLTIDNSTISGNTATNGSGFGGGLVSGGATTIGNSVIAGNSGDDCAGTVTTDQGGNLDSDGTCGLTSPYSKANQAPGLGPLANNGGPTQTMALLSGSPAIGQGVPAICAATPVSGFDQRGVRRPKTICDSGAYELTPAPPAQPAQAPVVLTWANPSALTYGTPLGSGQLDAVATSGGQPVGGTISYTPPIGTILRAGTNQQLIASYTPIGGGNPTASGLVTITVLPAPTSLSLSASAGTVGAGQSVTLTATASSPTTGNPIPTGSVSFSNGATLLGSAPLVNGVANLTLSTLPAGSLTITATYVPDLGSLGNANFGPSSASASLQVGQAATTTTLSSLHSTGTIGQQQRLTAWVRTVGPATPTGTVSFYDTGSGSQVLLGTVTLDGQGAAVLTDSTLSVGSHPLLVIYSGDGQNQGSQSALLNQTIASCSATALLISGGTTVLDLATSPISATTTAKAVPAHLAVRVGRHTLVVSDPAVTACFSPGQPDSQATISGSVTTGTGPFSTGDQVQLALAARPAAHGAPSLRAVLTDQRNHHRLALLGPFEKGSRIQISTP